MIVRKVNLLTEVKRLKRKISDPYDRATLDWARKWAEYGIAEYTRKDDVLQLERLFTLPDRRA